MNEINNLGHKLKRTEIKVNYRNLDVIYTLINNEWEKNVFFNYLICLDLSLFCHLLFIFFLLLLLSVNIITLLII